MAGGHAGKQPEHQRLQQSGDGDDDAGALADAHQAEKQSEDADQPDGDLDAVCGTLKAGARQRLHGGRAAIKQRLPGGKGVGRRDDGEKNPVHKRQRRESESMQIS